MNFLIAKQQNPVESTRKAFLIASYPKFLGGDILLLLSVYNNIIAIILKIEKEV